MDLQEISLQLQAGKAKIVKTLVQQAIDEGIPAQQILEERGSIDGTIHRFLLVAQKSEIRGGNHA